MIPRRLAYRTWAACCEREARRLRELASGTALDDARDRAGDRGVAGAAAKVAGRLREAAGLERAAEVLSTWAAGSGPRGGDLDAVVVGLVAVAIVRHTPAIDELRTGRTGAPRLDGAADIIPFVRWILETC